MKLHLVMPMGGAGTRFFNNGFDCPKPLLPLRGKPFFYWAAESVRNFIPISGLTFVVLREHDEKFSITDVIRSYYPEARTVILDHVLPGAVMTALEGVKDLPGDTPVVFNDCDHFFVSSAFEDFCRTDEPDCDGALLTFTSDEAKFSYLACNSDGTVCRTVEKEVISRDAICGAYYFRSASLFRGAAEKYLKTCSYSEYFMSGVYNELISSGAAVRAMPTDLHIPFGTPDELKSAENDTRLEKYGL